MSSSINQRYGIVVVLAAAVLGAGLVYMVMRRSAPAPPSPFRGELVSAGRPPDEPGSTEVARMSDDVRSALRASIAGAIAATNAPGQDAALDAATEYAAFLADGDLDRLIALAMRVDARPHAETVEQFRSMLAGFPATRQPDAWRTFNDIQVLHWGFFISRLARWDGVVLDTVTAQYFPAGDRSEAFEARWRMNPPPGYESSGDAMATLEMPGLYQRARAGDVASLFVSFAVRIERGDEWLMTLHLAEHAPGEWYPIAYRKDVARSVTPFAAERAPRPE